MLEIDQPLVTERLLLRPFTDADLDDVAAYHALPEVVRYLYWQVRDRDEVREVLVQRRLRYRLATDGDVLVLAVAIAKTGRVIGEVTYAYEAAARMLDLAFDEVGLHRVCGRTDGDNTASATLMRRLGLRQEAHFVQNEIFKGEWGDELVFAILADEWHARPQAGKGQGSARSNQRTSQ